MSGVGITYLWISKTFPPFIRLEGKRGDYEVYVPERTCRNIVADDSCDEFVCSECGYVVGAYEYGPDIGEHCKGCGAKVVDE